MKFVLLTMTFVCVSLATITTLPLLSLAVLPVVMSVALIYILLAVADRRFISHQPSCSRAIGSCILMSVSIWTVAFVLVASWIHIPGSFGPVQYSAGNAVAMFVFGLRVGTILMMFCAPVVSFLVGVIRIKLGMDVRIGWLVVAIGSYVAAWITVTSNMQFFPMV